MPSHRLRAVTDGFSQSREREGWARLPRPAVLARPPEDATAGRGGWTIVVGLEGEGTARDRLRGVGGRARGRGDAGGGTRARQRIDSRAERRERGPERASRGHSVVRHGPAFPPTSFFCTRRRRAPTHPSVQPHISPTRRCPFYGARSHLLRSVGPERRRASRLFLLGRCARHHHAPAPPAPRPASHSRAVRSPDLGLPGRGRRQRSRPADTAQSRLQQHGQRNVRWACLFSPP